MQQEALGKLALTCLVCRHDNVRLQPGCIKQIVYCFFATLLPVEQKTMRCFEGLFLSRAQGGWASRFLSMSRTIAIFVFLPPAGTAPVQI